MKRKIVGVIFLLCSATSYIVSSQGDDAIVKAIQEKSNVTESYAKSWALKGFVRWQNHEQKILYGVTALSGLSVPVAFGIKNFFEGINSGNCLKELTIGESLGVFGAGLIAASLSYHYLCQYRVSNALEKITKYNTFATP